MLSKKEIGDNLRRLRGDRSLTKVAKDLNISQSTLSMYETGQRIPRDECKEKLADYYGVPLTEIFFTSSSHET